MVVSLVRVVETEMVENVAETVGAKVKVKLVEAKAVKRVVAVVAMVAKLGVVAATVVILEDLEGMEVLEVEEGSVEVE